jgi:hypothetical protein
MKKIMLSLITLFLAGFATAVPASSPLTYPLVADIPFDFSVHDKLLPAGRYTIKEVSSLLEKVVEISSQDGKLRAIFLVDNAEAKEQPSTGKLVFHRLGGQNFLFQIFDPWEDHGAMVSKSRTERLLEKDFAVTENRLITIPTVQLAANK